MIKLEQHDMQGLIARGYDELKAATFFLLEITDEGKAKQYIRYVLAQQLITPAAREQIKESQKDGPRIDTALHIAFTSAGLSKMGLPIAILETFSREFLEGMTEPFRSHLLGDVGNNAPSNWEWGQPGGAAVHIMLLCYAKDQTGLSLLLADQQQLFAQYGIQITSRQDTFPNEKMKEHFGFRDGISTPFMEGLSKAGQVKKPIKAGEFVLGYPNEYDRFTDSPKVQSADDIHNILPSHPDRGFKDLGKNGTYLVFRQMHQDVFKFWQYLKNNSIEPDTDPANRAIKLGAKMVGRWPGGAPLTTSTFDNSFKSTFNDIHYKKEDANGVGCPFGAHIRRTNPRDEVFSGRQTGTSDQMVRKHQIIRRGRIYGEPLAESMRPEDILNITSDDGKSRGLHFICLASHISKQFEFIQNVWVNNPTFATMCSAIDPMISAAPLAPACNDFTVQASPVNRKYNNLPSFTRLLGGAYFFLPGINALHFIADAPARFYLKSKETDLAKETRHPKERLISNDIIHFFKERFLKAPKDKRFLRGFHAKSIGLVEATFIVNGQLEEKHQVGLFKRPVTYKAWVRFSNGSDKISADYKRGVRGMAIKILETGEAPIEKDSLGSTQDILLTNNKILYPGTVEKQLNAVKVALAQGVTRLISGLRLLAPNKISRLKQFLKGQIQITNVLEQTYFSGTPYLFGSGNAVKWEVRPVFGVDSRKMSAKPVDMHDPDFLRKRLAEDLSENEFCFKLFIQCQVDQESHPIEDASVEWDSPSIEVATIKILKQDFNIAERDKLEKDIVFTPWHSMPAHRPLGGINRIRREIYNELSRFRSKRID